MPKSPENKPFQPVDDVVTMRIDNIDKPITVVGPITPTCNKPHGVPAEFLQTLEELKYILCKDF